MHDDWFGTVSYANSSTSPKSLWNHIISSGYECEIYEISEQQDAWPYSEASTSREEVKKELDTSYHGKESNK